MKSPQTQKPRVATRPTARARKLIKEFEGLRTRSYLDTHDKWALGYGETGEHITEGLSITEHEAGVWLDNRIFSLSGEIRKAVTVPMSQGQFDALVSLAYNVGITAFKHSTLLKLLNQERYYEAASELLKWDHSQGKQIEGLSDRRRQEYQLFNE